MPASAATLLKASTPITTTASMLLAVAEEEARQLAAEAFATEFIYAVVSGPD